jgi:hypothetical protein
MFLWVMVKLVVLVENVSVGDTLTLITIRENYLIGCNCPYVLNICSAQEGPCHSITPMLIWK